MRFSHLLIIILFSGCKSYEKLPLPVYDYQARAIDSPIPAGRPTQVFREVPGQHALVEPETLARYANGVDITDLKEGHLTFLALDSFSAHDTMKVSYRHHVPISGITDEDIHQTEKEIRKQSPE